jgi:hypothetical protein
MSVAPNSRASAELAGQRLTVRVPAESDDPLAAQLAGGENAHESHRAVADHSHGLARAGLGGHRSEPPGGEHIGGRHERGDEVGVRPDGADIRADLLDDTDILVPHHLVVDRFGAVVGPQVAAADARRRQADDRIGRLEDLRILPLLHPHVARPVHDHSTHCVPSIESP